MLAHPPSISLSPWYSVISVLLGNVLAQTGLGKLEWNGTRVTNNEAANAYVKTTYRKGWEIPSV